MKRFIAFVLFAGMLLGLAGCGSSSSAKSCEDVLTNLCKAYNTQDYSLAVQQYPAAFLKTYKISESDLISYMKERREEIARKCGTSKFTLTYQMTEDNEYTPEPARCEKDYGFEPGSVSDTKYFKVRFYVGTQEVSSIFSLFVCVNGTWYLCDDEAP